MNANKALTINSGSRSGRLTVASFSITYFIPHAELPFLGSSPRLGPGLYRFSNAKQQESGNTEDSRGDLKGAGEAQRVLEGARQGRHRSAGQTCREVEQTVAGGPQVVARDLAQHRHGVAVIESAAGAEQNQRRHQDRARIGVAQQEQKGAREQDTENLRVEPS